jgi:hypothetical protein
MRRIAELHATWSTRHGDEVPNVGADPEWQADMYAPSEIDDSLNDQIKAILAQIDDESGIQPNP